jgi:hypothetical protein
VNRTWCFAVASALADPEHTGTARQWLEGDDRVVVVPLGDPMALTDWALARDGLEHLIYVGRGAHAPAMAVAANLLTGRLPSLRVSTSTWRTTTLSLAALSAQVCDTVETAHEAVAQLQQLVPVVWSGVWTPNVTALNEPQPTFGQHLRSLIPGRLGYLATLTPHLDVARLHRTSVVPVPPGSTLIMGGRLGEADLSLVQGQAVVAPPIVLAAVEDGKSQYGSSDAVELVWMQGGRALPPSRPSGWCQVCRSPVWGVFCPFCQVVVVSYQGVA